MVLYHGVVRTMLLPAFFSRIKFSQSGFTLLKFWTDNHINISFLFQLISSSEVSLLWYWCCYCLILFYCMAVPWCQYIWLCVSVVRCQRCIYMYIALVFLLYSALVHNLEYSVVYQCNTGIFICWILVCLIAWWYGVISTNLAKSNHFVLPILWMWLICMVLVSPSPSAVLVHCFEILSVLWRKLPTMCDWCLCW